MFAVQAIHPVKVNTGNGGIVPPWLRDDEFHILPVPVKGEDKK